MIVKNKIVYFGTSDVEATFLIGKEDDSEQLKVLGKEKGFYLSRGGWNTASHVFKNEIYAFKNGNYEEVHRYTLENGEWSLFFSHHQ